MRWRLEAQGFVVVSRLEQVEAELQRIGLLLEHDKQWPSATALIAGEPIAGSWWGHARGHEIYATLGELEQGSGALCVKLVAGKRTYVHPRLYGAFFALLEAHRPSSLARCSPLARELLATTERQGLVRMAGAQSLAPGKDGKRAVRELEDGLLVHVGSEHTESGKHEKTLESWPAWQARHACCTPLPSAQQARESLHTALRQLQGKLPVAPTIALLTEA